MAHHMTTIPRDAPTYVVISPPLGDVREPVTSRSLVDGEPPRSFPSIVVPRTITVSLINEWLNCSDLTALDMGVMTALATGSHGGRGCVFDNMSTRMALDRFLKNFESGGMRMLTHPRSSAVFSLMAENYNRLREYVVVAEEVFEWGETVLDNSQEWLSVERAMYTHQAEAARLAMSRDKLSLDEFRSALIAAKEVMDLMSDTDMPWELAQELLDVDWQRGCLKTVKAIKV